MQNFRVVVVKWLHYSQVNNSLKENNSVTTKTCLKYFNKLLQYMNTLVFIYWISCKYYLEQSFPTYTNEKEFNIARCANTYNSIFYAIFYVLI